MSNQISQEQKNILASNLNRLLKENNKTQTDLVNYFHLTASTVSDWCNAKKYPRVDKVQMLADYFGVRKSDLTEEPYGNIQKELLEAINGNDKVWARPLPVYKTINFCDNNYESEDFIRYIYIDDVEDFDNYIALLIPGNEFAPNFSENDIAIIHKQTNLEDKKYFYIVLKDNTHTIRKVIHQNNTLILQSDNSDLGLIFANENEVTIIGKVVAIQKSLKLE